MLDGDCVTDAEEETLAVASAVCVGVSGRHVPVGELVVEGVKVAELDEDGETPKDNDGPAVMERVGKAVCAKEEVRVGLRVKEEVRVCVADPEGVTDPEAVTDPEGVSDPEGISDCPAAPLNIQMINSRARLGPRQPIFTRARDWDGVGWGARGGGDGRTEGSDRARQASRRGDWRRHSRGEFALAAQRYAPPAFSHLVGGRCVGKGREGTRSRLTF